MIGLVWMAGAALAASPATSSEPHNHDHDVKSFFGSPEKEIEDLALNLDNAIKLCEEEDGRAASKTTQVGKREQLMLDRGLLKFTDTPPATLLEMSRNPKFGTPRFAQWFDPHATIWLVTYSENPVCKILVGGSPWTHLIRPKLYQNIQIDKFYKIDGEEKALGDGMRQAVFYATIPQQKSLQSMIRIVMPEKEVEGGLQMSITVAIIKNTGQQ